MNERSVIRVGWRGMWVCAVALLLAVEGVPAQEVPGSLAGRVVDAVTDRGIRGAILLVLDRDEAVVGRGFSGEEGRFLLELPAGGPYVASAESMGFEPVASDSFRIAAGDTLHLPPFELPPDGDRATVPGLDPATGPDPTARRLPWLVRALTSGTWQRRGR